MIATRPWPAQELERHTVLSHLWHAGWHTCYVQLLPLKICTWDWCPERPHLVYYIAEIMQCSVQEERSL